MGHDRLIFIAKLPGRMFWPVTYGLHAANQLGWASLAYPLAAIMVALYLMSVVLEYAVPEARGTG